MSRVLLVGSMFSLLCAMRLGAQQPTARDTAFLDAVLRAHRYSVSLKDGQLAGPGAKLLLEAGRSAQFFVIGESHNGAEVPKLTEALFNALHRDGGYNYYAVEYGPLIAGMLSAPGIRGNSASVFALGRRYPHAFQFWDDEELTAFATIGKLSTAPRSPIWGLDQEWGALHVLDSLAILAPTDSARRYALAVGAQARIVETRRPFKNTDIPHFITEADSLLFDSLRAAFHPQPGTSQARLLDALEVSNRIYRLWRNVPTRYDANVMRERDMKSRFMTEYRAAQAEDDSLPHVLVKVGAVHGGNWLSPTSVQSLGNFLHEFALANGGQSFHLVIWLVNRPGDYWTLGDTPDFRSLANVGSPDSWYVVDFRPLRALAYEGKLRAMSMELRKAVFAYDAVLLLGSGRPGTYDSLARRPPAMDSP